MKILFKHSTFIKVAVSLFLITYFVYRMDMPAITDTFSHSLAWPWILSLLFCLSQMVLLSMRWKMLINIGKKHLNFKTALKINLSSQLANLVFITSLGGLLARFALCVQYGVPITKIAIATLIDRLFTLAALVVLSIAFLPSLVAYIYNQTPSYPLFGLSVTIALASLFLPWCISTVIQRLSVKQRAKAKIRYGLRYLKVFTSKISLVTEVSIVSIVAQICFFVSVFMLMPESEKNISFSQLMAVLPIISLIAALPISIGGWGVREGAFIYGLGFLGVPMEKAFVISIQVGLIGIIAAILAGIPSLISSDFSLFYKGNWQKRFAKLRE